MKNPTIESRKTYEVAHKHNKPIIVMEPVKGGNLVKLPADAQKAFDEVNQAENTHICLTPATQSDTQQEMKM